MFEIESMIVPQRIEAIRPVDELLNVAYRLVDGKVLERVIYQNTEARVYRALTDVHLRTHFFNKPILNAFYHNFGNVAHPAPFLCISSEDELKLICLETNECHTNCLPIKIQMVFPTTHGLLLVRSENDDSENVRGPSILYSLSHPYSELLPVLCKFKGEENKPFIFMRRKIQLISSTMESRLILGYDIDENINYLFAVRQCTLAEKRMARENLLESTALNNSNINASHHSMSPYLINTNKSDATPSQRTLGSFGGTPNSSQLNWKNRFQRTPGSMGSPLFSRIHEHSQAESSTSRLFANLSQNASQSQHLDCTKATSILSMITGEVEAEFDPHAVELALECIWTDEVNRLGGRSPSRLPILSSLQTSAPIVQRSNRSRTKVEKEITEQFATNLCVTNKPTQTFVTNDLNNRNYFVFVVPGNNTVKIFPYNDGFNVSVVNKLSTIQANHAAPLLNTKYWIAAQNSPVLFTLFSGVEKIADLTISCIIREPEFLVLSHVHQLISRDGTEFEMIAEFRPTIEPSPTKEPVSKKARRGIVSPQKRQLHSPDPFECAIITIRTQSESQPLPMLINSPAPKSLQAVYSQPNSALPDDQFVMPAKKKTTSTNIYQLVKVYLNSGTTTLMGKRLHDTILNALSDRNKLKFEREWLCKNVYRYVREEFSQMIELEIAFLFESLFEAIGINPGNFPFMDLIKRAKGADEMRRSTENKPKIKKENDVKYPFLDEFMTQLDSSKAPTTSHQIEARTARRDSFINSDHVGILFRELHKMFDSLKRNKDRSVLRARQSMSQPMFILAGLYNIQKASQLYMELYPELSRLQVIALRQQPRISFNDGKLSFDAIDHLCESFELDFATKKPFFEPVLTNTQRNKLRVLPTQAEIARWIKLRWPTDIRVYNVNTMLDSSKPVLIPDLRVSATMSDAQLRDYQEKFLLNVALRTITRSFGAALLNFHSKQAEPMEVAVTEKICLHGKISPSNMNLEYPIQDTALAKLAHKHMMEWANFYNGVSRGLSTILSCGDNKHFDLGDQTGAAAKELKRVKQVIASQTQHQIAIELQLHQEDQNQRRPVNAEDDGPSVVDWEWVFSKIKENKECSPALAGFVLAAGLSGQSMSVNPFDLHEFLSLSDKLVVVSLLLGTSVAYRGTSNFYINKMIYAHLPFLLQPTLCDFRIEPVIQTVALLSLGYLFAKSMNSQLTNDLINQMSKETFFETDLASERYAYVLSAGFAVGLINLGKGNEIELMERTSANNKHLQFHERLFLLLNGGRRDLCIVNYQKDLCEISQKACCSCGMSRSDQKFQPSQHQHHHRQRADYLTVAGSAGGGAAGAAGNPSAVASSVAAASSHVSELSTINIHLSSPAACVAFALVYMRTNLEHIAKNLAVPSKIYSIRLIRPDIIMLRTLASCLVMFDSISNTNDWVAKQIPKILRTYGGKHGSSDTDLPMLSRSYAYVRTGACFALALKYTSTRDERTTKILLQWFNELVDDFEKEDDCNTKSKLCGANTYVTCINVMMSALAIVNAGSGDVSLVKQFRRVRNSNTQFTDTPKEGTLYSTHVIANMCLGLLFLGNGRYGLSSSNMSLASLLIAFFPIYGHSIHDNRCYFQGFRYLWTLAVEPRFLVTVAEGYQETIVAPLEIGFKDENMKPINDKTPYLLPPLELISIIRIKAPDYQPIELDLQKAEDMQTLREVLTDLSGRLPLKKPRRACGSHEFRTLDPKLLIGNDLDLNDNCSEHSFADDTL